MAGLLNRARMTTTTTGTGTITLGSAATGYATFAEAGAVNAAVYAYTIEDGNDFEIGVGTYTSSGTTFSRDAVTLSKISGTSGTSKINLSGSAQIFITARVEDLTPAYALISRQVASNSASLAWTNLDTATYDSFEIVFDSIVPALTFGVNLLVQIGTGGTPTWVTTGYLNPSTGSGGIEAAFIAPSTATYTTAAIGSGEAIGGNFSIGNLASSSVRKFGRGVWSAGGSGAGQKWGNFGGYYDATTAITAVRLIFSIGNVSSGVASLYGRRSN